MCGCDRWHYCTVLTSTHYDSTHYLNLWERRTTFGLTAITNLLPTPAAEAKCTLLETQRLTSYQLSVR